MKVEGNMEIYAIVTLMITRYVSLLAAYFLSAFCLSFCMDTSFSAVILNIISSAQINEENDWKFRRKIKRRTLRMIVAQVIHLSTMTITNMLPNQPFNSLMWASYPGLIRSLDLLGL